MGYLEVCCLFSKYLGIILFVLFWFLLFITNSIMAQKLNSHDFYLFNFVNACILVLIGFVLVNIQCVYKKDIYSVTEYNVL